MQHSDLQALQDAVGRAGSAERALDLFAENFRADSTVVVGDQWVRMGSSGPSFRSTARCFYNDGWVLALGVWEDHSAVRVMVGRTASAASRSTDGVWFGLIGNFPVAEITRPIADEMARLIKRQLWKLDSSPACAAAEANRAMAELAAL